MTNDSANRQDAALLRERGLLAAGCGVAVLLTLWLPMRGGEPAWWAVIAPILGILLFVVPLRYPAFGRASEVWGGIAIAGLVAVLVAGTGGGVSPYQDAYVAVLVFVGAVRSLRRLVVDAVVVAVFVSAPAVYSEVERGFATDALFDFVVWTGVALIVHSVVGRLGILSRREARLEQRLEAFGEMTSGVVYRRRLEAHRRGGVPRGGRGERDGLSPPVLPRRPWTTPGAHAPGRPRGLSRGDGGRGGS